MRFWAILDWACGSGGLTTVLLESRDGFPGFEDTYLRTT